MPRGGARAGRAGASYGNRSDLNVSKLPAVAAPGQTYGVAGQQLAAQQAVPMGGQPQAAAGVGQGEGPAPAVLPGSLGALNRPTDRPGEPLTAGAPHGPGPNGVPTPLPPPDPLLATAAALASLGDALHPMLHGVVAQLQAAQGNGAGA